MAFQPAPAGLPQWTGPLAQTPLGRMISGSVGRLLELRSDLNVTDQQRGEIRDVIVSHRSEIASTVKSVREKRTAVRDLVRADDAEEAQIRAAADELGKAIGDAAVKAAKLRKEIAPILTDEQHELIDQFLEKNDSAANSFLDAATQGQ